MKRIAEVFTYLIASLLVVWFAVVVIVACAAMLPIRWLLEAKAR